MNNFLITATIIAIVGCLTSYEIHKRYIRYREDNLDKHNVYEMKFNYMNLIMYSFICSILIVLGGILYTSQPSKETKKRFRKEYEKGYEQGKRDLQNQYIKEFLPDYHLEKDIE